MELKSAIETGLVESNLRKLPGGDGDSVLWRQERASLYKNPGNLRDSVDRYFRETRAVRGQYGTAGELAAAVQRPAAQFRGRYQQQSALADKLRGSDTGSAGGSSQSSPGTPGANPTSTPSFDPGQAAGLTAMLAAQKPQVQISGPKAPGFSAAPTLPGGYAPVPSVAPQAPAASSLSEQLASMATPQELPQQPDQPAGGQPSPSGGGSGSGGGSSSGGGGRIKEIFYNGPGAFNVKDGKRVPKGFVSGHEGHVHVATGGTKSVERLGRLAESMGLHVGEQDKWGGRPTGGHAPNSNHYRGTAIDVSGDPRKMAAFARRVAREIRR